MAILNKCTVLIVFCFFPLLSRLVYGIPNEILLTEEEELQIDNQFKLLNKPAVMTIRTKNGDLYDCVDFYKQPAFDHPSLKNHTFHPQMRPSSLPKSIGRDDTKSKSKQMKFIRIGCPTGTVPIRKITREDLVRAMLLEKKYNLMDEGPSFHYAIVRTRPDPNKLYNGASAFISLYNLTLDDHSQFSLSRMRIQSGTDSIEVGSMTNPGIYNNLDTHIFIRTKTNGLPCFNMQCPGFVLINTKLGIDPIVKPASRIGGPTWDMKYKVYREYDGNWWFILDESNIPMGFWPSTMFSGGLQGLASSIDWGGETFSPAGILPPPMGSGLFPLGYNTQDAFAEFLKIIHEKEVEVDVVDTEVYYTNIDYYQVEDRGFRKGHGHLMTFGGPGGNNDNDSSLIVRNELA